MNYYVTKTDADAIKAINLLSNSAKGKANFFILDRFKHYKASPVKIYDNAFPASEIAEYDKTYSQLVSYILDKVLCAWLFNSSLFVSVNRPTLP